MNRIVTLALAAALVSAIASPAAAQTCNVAPSAQYQLTFNATWSSTTLPQSFPSSAHFSGLVGGVHNNSVAFWTPGENASAGIKQVAETGSKTSLINEVNAAVNAGTASSVVSGSGISVSPGTASVGFIATLDHSLVSVVTMIAPSPDWFVGTHGQQLFQDGNWVASLTVPVFGYDAGTDDGPTYTSPNDATVPAEPIALLDGPLFRVEGELVPFGNYVFVRTTPSCLDADGDDVDDETDNCLGAANAQQVDADGDGYGNVCDADFNNDCNVNLVDLVAFKAGFAGSDPVLDLNSDGAINLVDLIMFKARFAAAPGPSAQTAVCN